MRTVQELAIGHSLLQAQVAAAFARSINEALTPEEFTEVLALNMDDDAGCATHNYIDANMNMDEAFVQVLGRSVKTTDPGDCDLFNRAWDLAKQNEFDVQLLEELVQHLSK